MKFATKRTIIVCVAALGLLCASHSSAQQDSVGSLGLTVREDNLDSFWLEQRNWNWYGYRPYKLHVKRFDPSLPTWNTGTSGYSFGITEPAGNAPWEGGPQVPFKMTKYGTWH